jgi:aspartyl-tRNA(Asn)/glutamyl-tRNA(Gln) amidotransferase subunit A
MPCRSDDIVATAEASSNLARFDGVRYGSRSDGDSYRDALDQTRGDLFLP